MMKRRRQGKTCVVGGCANSTEQGWSVFQWPSSEETGRKWSSFIASTRKWSRDDYKLPHVCSGHFTAEQFANLNEWRNGFASRLRLTALGFPSVRVADSTLFVRKAASNLSDQQETVEEAGRAPEDGFVLHTSASPAKKPSKAVDKLNVNRLVADLCRTQAAEQAAELAELQPKDACAQTELLGSSVQTQTWPDTFRTNRAVQTVKVSSDRGVQATVRKKDSVTQTSLVFECPSEGESQPPASPAKKDPDYAPPRQSTQDQATRPDPMERKYIVFHSQLMALFSLCFLCQSPTEVDVKEIGSCATVTQKCSSCKKSKTWSSQPFIRQLPMGNLLLSAAVLVSGCVVSKALRLFEYLNLACISRSTFYRHQRKYLWSHIITTWQTQQRGLLAEAAQSEGGLVLEGDARCDSPGHSAKFGTYSFIDASMNKVIAFAVLQCNEVKSSYHMEMEGLIRVVESLGDLVIKTLVTDRHRSIAKYIRETMPNVAHLFDVWHVSKAIRKKIEAAAKKPGCEVLSEWKRSINNHLYWCAVSTPGHDALMGKKTGKVVKYAYRSKTCRICAAAKAKSAPPKVHRCFKNWEGSAKGMEPDMALQMVKDLYSENKQVAGLQPYTASNHIYPQTSTNTVTEITLSRTLHPTYMVYKNNTRNYSTTSSHTTKSFSQQPSISQCSNKPDTLASRLNALVGHTFGDHQKCSDDWCKALALADSTDYKYKYLPGQKPLQDPALRAALEALLTKYSESAEKLATLKSSQVNESLNNSISKKAPKHRHLSGSGSLFYRVSAAVAEKNEGSGYIAQVNQRLGMSPGKRTQLFAERLDRQRSRHRLYNSTLSRKRRRRVLKELRLNKASSTETREGPTYESSIDMREGVVDVTEIPPPVLAPTATPLENVNNPIIYFDLETTGFENNCDISQLSAVCGDKSFDQYVLPTKPISKEASEATSANNLCCTDSVHGLLGFF